MTYCIGVMLDKGMIFASDSRTNAGVDNFAKFCKMTVFERRDNRVVVLLSSGNLYAAHHPPGNDFPISTLFLDAELVPTTAGQWITHPPTRCPSGMFLVAGVSVKLFALAYVVAVVGYLLWIRRPGWLLSLAGGGLLAVAVVIAPFVVSAPARAWHDVVVTQLRRARNPFVPDGLDRVVNMVGLADITIPLALVLIALLAVISFRRFDPQVGLWVSVLVITAAAFAMSPTYFTHYGEFLGPAVALLVSRALDIRRGALIAIAFAVAFVIGTGVELSDLGGQQDLRAATSAIPNGSCVYSDAISLPLMAGVYTAPSPRCPSYVDGRGVALTQNTTWDNRVSFYPDGFVADKCWQEAKVEQMRHADYLLLRYSPPTFPEWNGSTRAYVLSHFTLAVRHPNGRKPFELWKRTTPRAHGGAAANESKAQRRLQQAADALVQRP